MAKNGFDFNKCIREGISFLSPREEQREVDYQQERQDARTEPIVISRGGKGGGRQPCVASDPIRTDSDRDFVNSLTILLRNYAANTPVEVSPLLDTTLTRTDEQRSWVRSLPLCAVHSLIGARSSSSRRSATPFCAA